MQLQLWAHPGSRTHRASLRRHLQEPHSATVSRPPGGGGGHSAVQCAAVGDRHLQPRGHRGRPFGRAKQPDQYVMARLARLRPQWCRHEMEWSVATTHTHTHTHGHGMTWNGVLPTHTHTATAHHWLARLRPTRPGTHRCHSILQPRRRGGAGASLQSDAGGSACCDQNASPGTQTQDTSLGVLYELVS